MIDALLSPATIGVGAVISWISALGLIYAARRADPPIGALTERAVIAVIISTFLTIYAVVAFNTDTGFAIFPFADGVRLLRIGVLCLALVGPVWLVLWWSGNLGDGGRA